MLMFFERRGGDNWCAVMPFFMLKIVGGVGSNFGTVTFCTAADDLLWSYFVFAFP